MSKVNFVIDIEDPKFEQAAEQAIKRKVRELVNESIEEIVTPIIESTVKKRMDALRSDLGYQYGRTKFGEIIEQKVCEAYIDAEIVHCVEKHAKEMDRKVLAYQKEYLEETNKFIQKTKEEAPAKVEALIKDLTAAALTKALLGSIGKE